MTSHLPECDPPHRETLDATRRTASAANRPTVALPLSPYACEGAVATVRVVVVVWGVVVVVVVAVAMGYGVVAVAVAVAAKQFVEVLAIAVASMEAVLEDMKEVVVKDLAVEVME